MGRLKSVDSRLGSLPARVRNTVQPGSWRQPDATSTKRGYGYAWQKAREGHLRSHPFCVMCLVQMGLATEADCRRAFDGEAKAEVMLVCAERGLVVPWAHVVDHRTPHRGEQTLFWNRANWQSLCTPHHSRDKQRTEAALGGPAV